MAIRADFQWKELGGQDGRATLPFPTMTSRATASLALPLRRTLPPAAQPYVPNKFPRESAFRHPSCERRPSLRRV